MVWYGMAWHLGVPAFSDSNSCMRLSLNSMLKGLRLLGLVGTGRSGINARIMSVINLAGWKRCY